MADTNILNVGGADLSSTNYLAGGVTNSTISETTNRPYTPAQMDVDNGMIWEALNRKLQIESTLGEVFLDIGADTVFIPGKPMMVPDAVIKKVNGNSGARTQTMGMINPLAGAGRIGTGEKQQGYERFRTIEYQKVYYNEYSQAVMEESWGVNYNDLEVWDYYAQVQPGLSKWFAEEEGKHYRQALLQRYAEPLWDDYSGAGSDGAGLSELNLNNNWFIANTDVNGQPSYSATAETFHTNITTAMAAADTGTSGVNANIDLDYLLALDYYAQNSKRIEPVTIGGKPSYIVLLPSTQYHKLLLDNDGQLGGVWTKVSALTAEEQSYPGIVGRVKNLVIIEDQRYPTWTSTNNYGDNNFTIEYVQPANNDARPKTVYAADSNATWDIGFLMGKDAITDWNVRDLHFESENTEYGKLKGRGAFRERGIQATIYDVDTAGNAIKNFGSIVLAFTATSILTVA